MLFKEFMNAHTIFVDLDDTLVKSMPLEYFRSKNSQNANGKIFDWNNTKQITFLRPYAKELINHCKKLADTCIFTHGHNHFQKEVISVLNLPIKCLYGREDYHKVPKTRNAILIDDDPQIASQKLKAIGTEKLILVKPWNFEDLDDTELLDLIKKI